MSKESRRVHSDAMKQKAINLHAMGWNQREIATELGVGRSTIGEWIRDADKLGLAPGAIHESEEWEQEKVKLQDQIRDLQYQIRATHRDNLTAEVVRKHILDLADQPPEPPHWTIDPKVDRDALVPVATWSDWHWGEVVDPDQIGHSNEFNLAVAQERARRLVEKTVMLVRREAGDGPIPGIVVNLGGDMVSGDIHEELRETNELPVMPVLLDLYGVLIWALNVLADEFGHVFVVGVAGNHGRNSHKPRFKNRAYTNFDWLLYSFLEKAFQDDDRFQFQVPVGADAYYRVFNHRFLLTHGDNLGTAGGDGMIGALGPILRGDHKVRRASMLQGQDYDTLVIGHWHQFMPLLHIITNGSLKGYDEFAKYKLRARPEPPIQALTFVNPQYGITDTRAVYLEKPSPFDAKAPWVSWQAAA